MFFEHFLNDLNVHTCLLLCSFFAIDIVISSDLQGYKVSLLWHVVRVAIRRNMFYNSLQGTGILFRDTNTNMEKILAKKQQG